MEADLNMTTVHIAISLGNLEKPTTSKYTEMRKKIIIMHVKLAKEPVYFVIRIIFQEYNGNWIAQNAGFDYLDCLLPFFIYTIQKNDKHCNY